MKNSGLASFVEFLKNNNELIKIKSFVNSDLEITEVYDRIAKTNGPALLFENNGTNFPLLINMFGSEKRVCYALNIDDIDDVGKKIELLFKDFTSPKQSIFEKLKLLPQLAKVASFMPKKVKGLGECQKNVIHEPSLNILPILKCWPHDGGRFITLPLVHTIDLSTKIQNVGMYRMQIIDDNTRAMHWHIHKTGAKHFNEYKKNKSKMPVSVVLGGDPVYTYSATAPLPENVDEYILAGFLRNKNVNLVKCITNDLYIPSDADIVIEGYIDTSEDFFFEGPFGDHTGYYSLPDYYPKFHVTCITHKDNAIFPATVVGVPPQEDAFLGLATERIFLKPIQLSMLPEIVDMHLPVEGGFHNIAIIKISKFYPGHAQKVMSALWGAGQMMFNKIMVIVDGDIDIRNPKELIGCISKNTNINLDILISSGPSDVLDHSSYDFAFGGKIGIDATTKDAKNNLEENDFELFYSKIPQFKVDLRYIKFDVLLIVSNSNSSTEMEVIQQQILSSESIVPKFIILVDSDMIYKDDSLFIWRLSSNIDPAKDVKSIMYKKGAGLLINACSKNKTNGFYRDCCFKSEHN